MSTYALSERKHDTVQQDSSVYRFRIFLCLGGSQPFKAGCLPRSNTVQNLTRQVSTASSISPSLSAAEKCSLMKNELLEKVEILAPHLPPNTLDELIDKLGGPNQVAEVGS